LLTCGVSQGPAFPGRQKQPSPRASGSSAVRGLSRALCLGTSKLYNQPFEDDLLISMETLTYDTPDGPKQWEKVSTKKLRKWKKKALWESPENSSVDTPDVDEESDADIVPVRRKCEDMDAQSLCVADGKIQKKVRVDVIVQDYARQIPKWIMKEPHGSSEGLHLASPVQELIGNQASVCSKEVELANEYSSRPLQLQFWGVPISPGRITIPRHRLYPELNKTCCDSLLEEYQSESEECSCSNVTLAEECSWSNVTLADLYPAMVQILKRVMTKRSLKYMFGHLRHKRWHSRRPKLNITVDKIRGFRPLKMKQALPRICSSRREDVWNLIAGQENRELCDDSCSINDLSDLVPYFYTDTNEIKMDCSDSSSEHHLLSAKGPNVSKQTVFPNVMPRMGETFLVEDELETTVSLKNSKCKESEKSAYGCSSEYHFIASNASSWSTAFHLVKESKTQKAYFPCGGTSVLCSSTCSSYGNSNTITPLTNTSLARTSNTLLISPEKITSGGQISFQCKDSFSSLSVKQSPSKMPQKYKDAFEELYYKLSSKEIQKPLTLTRVLSNSQNLEEKDRLVKNNLSASARSSALYDRALTAFMSNCPMRLFQNFLGCRDLQI
ncbi:PREDICTED: LOW QUALITY PROTEIN: uncharacterized protein LOC103779290, partial [Merops nubicus]|uniref:LOW QUALITY PROTEIN: uncharacterized protein LOC103779290 n=1 Tax=Merops nubicus TaxID=57421 RepID=UPI0004F0291D